MWGLRKELDRVERRTKNSIFLFSNLILNGKKPEPQYAVPNLPLVTYYSYVLTCLFFCELRNARFKGKRVSTKKSSVPRMKRGGCAGPGGGRAGARRGRANSISVFSLSQKSFQILKHFENDS